MIKKSSLVAILACSFFPDIYFDHGLVWLAVVALVASRLDAADIFWAAATLSFIMGCLDPRAASSVAGAYFSLYGLVCSAAAFWLGQRGVPRAVFLIAFWANMALMTVGHFTNDSLGLICSNLPVSAFVAVLLACILYRYDLLLLAALTIFLHSGTSAIVAAGVAAVLMMWFKGHRRALWIMAVPVLLVALWLAVYRRGLPHLFLVDRLPIYKMAVAYWWQEYAPWGVGFNRFGAIARNIQEANQFELGQFWLSLHNDWVQFLVELGWLYPAWLGLWASMLRKADPAKFTSLVVLGLFALVYFPFRIYLFWYIFGYLQCQGGTPQEESPSLASQKLSGCTDLSPRG
jgi:hypothetical protein